ncbi:MAG: hypothetical protein HY796_02920 [Elusimicrobia bacterium]|nr:hypothetical protein [Elusimicrobiota bacterium]
MLRGSGKKYPKDAAKQSDCYTLCTGITAGAAAQCRCCQDYNSLCTTFVTGCASGGCGEYDPKKSCCINKKVVDKLQTPKTWLTSIRDCKNRVQAVSEKIVKPEKQGCSIGIIRGTFINIWRLEKRIILKLIFKIDNTLPLTIDFNDPFDDPKLAFRGSCNTHDYCYGTCRQTANDAADRRKCDGLLLKDLKAVCNKAKDPTTMDQCLELAGVIHWGLSLNTPIDGGPAAYRDAQIQHCKCDLCP